jgi:chemotaxis regulatin CheY-phosphate phosphatase CheZ
MTTEKKQNQVTDEELVAFEKMQQRVSKNLGELYDRINEETISQAIDKATTELKEAGGHSSEAISKASAALKKDIASTTKYLKPKLDQATEETKKLFDHWLDKGGALWHDIAQEAEHVYELSRDKGGAFLVNVTRGLSEWSQSVIQNR